MQAAEWGADVCYSCTQKGLGAPSGLAPVTFSRRIMDARVPSRSFYLDVGLLEDYWVRRKYHHTLSAPLIYALHAALVVAEEEGLEARWARHRRHHLALAAGLERLGISLLPPVDERLWTLNAVRVPDGVDEAAVRRASARRILDRDRRRPWSARGPDLAGRPDGRRLDAVERRAAADGARTCAPSLGLSRRFGERRGRRRGGGRFGVSRKRRRGPGRVGQVAAAAAAAVFAYGAFIYVTLPDVRTLQASQPGHHGLHRAARARSARARRGSQSGCSAGSRTAHLARI